MNEKIIDSLSQGGPIVVLFALTLWYIFTKHIPQLHDSFKNSLQMIVDSYEKSISAISNRLDRIEEDIKNK